MKRLICSVTFPIKTRADPVHMHAAKIKNVCIICLTALKSLRLRESDLVTAAATSTWSRINAAFVDFQMGKPLELMTCTRASKKIGCGVPAVYIHDRPGYVVT